MMRWPVPVILAAVSLLIAASPQDEAVRKDLENFQGTWSVVSMEMDGKFMSESDRKKIKLVIQGETFRFHNGAESEPGLYKIEPGKNPQELNIVITEGGDKGKIYLVIYKFEEGKMIQCMELSNAARPKSFTGKAGSGCALEVWQREKP